MEVEHLHEYEDLDSSSSSSENHSSPSTNSDSAYSATSHPEWALDLGISIPTLHSNWTHPAAFKAAPIPSTSSSMHTSNPYYWDAPQRDTGVTVDQQSEAVMSGKRQVQREVGTEADTSLDAFPGNDPRRSIEMEFDDMINEDSCGPSTGNSPLSLQSHSPPMPSRQHAVSYSHISMPAIQTSPPPPPHSFLASTGLALQLPPPSSLPPLVSGIAPSLTGGQPTPPLGSPITHILPEIPVSQASPRHTSVATTAESTPAPPLPVENVTAPSSRPARERRSSSRAGGLVRSVSHSASSSRERVGASQVNPSHAPHSSAPIGTGVNLVSREAIQVTQLIPHQSNPSPSALTGSSASSSAYTPPVKLLVLGVPTHGAKSRVETQIKISLSLVRPFGGIKREGHASDWADNLINEDGSVDSTIASDELERIGTWSHIQIPKYLALKSRTKDDGKPTLGKKLVNPGPPPPPEDTLVLDVAVVRASDPSSQIFICTNCRARELKRSLRKKDPKGKTAPPATVPVEDSGDKDEEEEKRKVVVFNSPEFVEFGTGECVLPTRVTCYCRHHKEKKGFCVTYSLRDHLDNIVASGMTPPIMITDDHKTSVAKHAQAAAVAPVSTASQRNSSLDSKRKASGKISPPATIVNAKKEKVAQSSASSTASARSRRAGGRSRRGASESGDAAGEEEAEPASKKAKPYDAEARPKKRQPPASRHSPAFAMTPLTTGSGANFPPPAPPSTAVHSTVPTPAASPAASFAYPQGSRATSPMSQHSAQGSFVSALGLDGISNGRGGDAIMLDSASAVQSPTFVPPTSFSPRHSVSTDSSIPPQHQAHNIFDWRSHGANSTISTPPLSPGATTPSVHNETFNSLFGTFPSPSDSQQRGQAALPVSSIPSFAIPATEPLQSLTSTWAFQQALQQQQQEIAASMPPPRINRLIPGEGPVSGGIEVTILGENFVRDLTCLFGDSGAVSTHFWSTNTLVCVLPPSANPGPVFVGIKGVLHNPEQGGLPLFTYKDNSDRNLLELALQVVGLKMTGRLEDASAVAMRIVGNSPGGGGAGGSHQVNGVAGTGGPQDTAALAATLNAAAASAYATPVQSRPASRRSSTSSPRPSTLPVAVPAIETRNFEGIVIKFLSLLDLDPSTLPGAAPSLPSASPPISQPDAQRHTLLHLATVLGFHRLVTFLLARGIDCDAADRNGYTALHFAALYGRVAITRHLIEAGADASLETFAGKTAMEIAQDRDDVDVEELLSRVARSPTSTHEQITPRISGRALAASSSASPLRPASLYSESDREEVDGDSLSVHSETDGSDGEDERSDWSRTASDHSWDESSDWPSDSEDAGEDADAEEAYERPIRSRNASTISLHYLVEAEKHAQGERAPSPLLAIASTKNSDVIEVTPPKPSLRAVTSSSWLSKKLKPTVQPGLDKLQPLAGGMTNAWEKAKANRFALPQMHMPELAVFPAMPAALTRRMSTTRRRPEATSAGEDTDGGEESSWEGASRHWRALYSGQWWHKTPSSPPPQYTPSDSLYLPNATNPDEKRSSTGEAASTSSSLAARPSPVQRLSRRSRKLSIVSDDTDDAASIAASDFEVVKHDGNDRMLFFFWIPVLLSVLIFAYLNFQVYLTPVIETLADTILPQPLANLLT